MLHSLGIVEAVNRLTGGEISAEQLASDCLKRIDEFEPEVQAFAWLDKDYVLNEAQQRDMHRRKGKPMGRLHGVPIAVKDIIDTALIPTEYGCEYFSGRLPKQDAWLVQRLREEGAVMLGKTVTAQLAGFPPGKTRNPHNSEHTPGGSSSGSAAAVAAFMAPGAIGTQTAGSVIRPASFCGTVGFKPSYGLIPKTGVLCQSYFLDQVGVLTRSVQDAALLAEVMIGQDPGGNSLLPTGARPPLLRICNEDVPANPKFALIKTSNWERCPDALKTGFMEIADALGEQIEEVELPAHFDSVLEWQKIINDTDVAINYGDLSDRAGDKVHAIIKEEISAGREVRAVDYLEACTQRDVLNDLLDEMFQVYDAFITPAALGEAPRGLERTGDPLFCSAWTFCGVPAISLPLLQGENGLPIGVQLIGQLYDDGRLLRTAKWLNDFLISSG